jgi:hypothetical protein
MSSRLRPVATRQAATITQSLQKLVHVFFLSHHRVSCGMYGVVQASQYFSDLSLGGPQSVCFGSCSSWPA